MKTVPSFALVVLISMSLCVGCSVKEDRWMCPCRLTLDFSEVNRSVIGYADLFVEAGGGSVFTDHLESEDLNGVMTVDVPKGEVFLGVWSGVHDLNDGGGFRIPYGEDCPPVYFHTSSFTAVGESVREVVGMHKNHCVMTLTLGWNDVDVKTVTITGNVDGYAADGSPTEGQFLYESEMEGGSDSRIILPRQIDDSLVLEVNDDSGVVKRFALGEYIAASGYDWSEPDLKDISIEMDLAFLRISLTVQGWESSHRFEVVI